MDARRQFHGDLQVLQQDLLKMGSLVEESIFKAVRSLTEQDLQLAEQVLAGDDLIDQMEIDIETRSLQLIALQQPMAGDLRILGTALKAVTDLERMADHSVDIAKVVLRMNRQPWIKPLIDIPRMADKARSMLREALDAFVAHDAKRAKQVADDDDEVDALYDQVYRELLTYMIADPSSLERATWLLWVAHNLERIADRVTNICERVVYEVTGRLDDMNVSKY